MPIETLYIRMMSVVHEKDIFHPFRHSGKFSGYYVQEMHFAKYDV